MLPRKDLRSGSSFQVVENSTLAGAKASCNIGSRRAISYCEALVPRSRVEDTAPDQIRQPARRSAKELFSMNRVLVLSVAATLSVGLSVGCSSKKYVRSQTGPTIN